MALKVLSALDTATTQYYHFKAIVIAGMGLFTDAYDLFCIPPIMKLIGRIYYDYESPNHKPGEVPPTVISISITIALLGAVIGQLVFGWLGDRIGRKRVYGLSLMLMVSSSIGCGFSICRTTPCVILSLCFFRFLLGVGIGGDYPISATIMSEFSNKKTRGSFIAAVFSMQGLGIIMSSVVTMVFCSAFKAASKASSGATPDEADLVWRLILMVGAIPAGLTYYWRMMMPETARYTALVEQNISQAVKDMEKVLAVSVDEIAEEFVDVPVPPSYGLGSKKFLMLHGRDLFACASSWFLVDVVFYSSNLFLSKIFKGDDDNAEPKNIYQETFDIAELQAIFAVCSALPGYWATVFFIDRVGRVKIQIMGFFGMAISSFAVAICYYRGNSNVWWFYVLYGFIFFFSNFGPNTTTFIVPAELFPARFRSTCHGISGAVGKIGAIIGSIGYYYLVSPDKKKNADTNHKEIGKGSSLMMLGGVCVLGMILTYLFTRETMGRSLEENENEEQTRSEPRLLRCFTNTSDRTHASI
ncbi:hypothetical protein IFM89_020588 [Coptis chinensis]|uniref:Major facilitator superfamily (MFS) profile domain-containing protein n=1 Tax=Coptis chinensis TaxID=261450 RepID=A0A835IQA2_9MAGN|nr:hypothetical protein IFM89_020588 [Coptis chinensis]